MVGFPAKGRQYYRFRHHIHPPDGGLKVSDDPPKSIIRLRGAIEVRGNLIESTSGVENHFERMQCVLMSVIKMSVRDLHGQETQR